jgi:uncharacterized protein YndB with AHSA1/START domain
VLIREDIVTRASPERIWELLSDPSLHGLWNPHVVSTEAWGSGTRGTGFRYRVTYELSGKQSEFDAEITEFSPPLRFAARLEERVKADGKNWQRFVEETYRVTRRGQGAHVRHEVRIHHSGINVLWRILIWLILRTGKPQGQTIMERFRQLAEGEATPAALAAGGAR